MTKPQALQIIIDLKRDLDNLNKVKGFAALRTSLKNKIQFIKIHKTDSGLLVLLTKQAQKDFDEYRIALLTAEERIWDEI